MIRLSPDLALGPAALAVVAELFGDYDTALVEGRFDSGQSGALVLKVVPFRQGSLPELPAVVKVDRADAIRTEYEAYRRFIRGRLSGIPEVWGEPAFVTVDRPDPPPDGGPAPSDQSAGGAWGGLRYSLVGAGLFDIVSLRRYAQTASAADVVHILEDRLFVHLGSIWRQSREVADRLGAGYDRQLRSGLDTEFERVVTDLVRGPAGTVAPAERPDDWLPNPLAALPQWLDKPIRHRVSTVHGDLNLENVLVDPTARTVGLIDFSHSRDDHVLHDLLRLETGWATRVLAPQVLGGGTGSQAVIDLYRQLHLRPDEALPSERLRPAFLGLVAIRQAAAALLADRADWTEYLVGLAAYLVGAGRFADLPDPSKSLAFWAAATALQQVEGPVPDAARLDRAIAVHLQRNPQQEAYRLSRVAEWSGPRYELDERFVELSLLVDQGEASTAGRWQGSEKRFASLRSLLAAVNEPALVVLGAPGAGKSTLLRRLELELALAGLGGDDLPLTFYLPLNHYKPDQQGQPPPPPRRWLSQHWAARHPQMPDLVELLAEGRMVLLLDALNEMPASGPAEARDRVLAWKAFVQELASASPGNRVIFSCRSLDYSTPLSTPALRVPQVQIEPLSEDQVRLFLDQYLPHLAERLWAELSGGGYLDVVRSPYFLKLLVQNVEASGEVPLGRAALFTGFVRQALQREVERDHPLFRPGRLLAERDLHRLTVARGWRTGHELPERGRLIPRLAALAFGMQLQNEAGGERAQVRIDYDAALGLLDDEVAEDVLGAGAALGVIEEDADRDEVLFVHQLVQEYFAARQLAVRPNPTLLHVAGRGLDRDALTALIDTLPPADELPPLPQTGWEETAILAAAMAEDPTAFVGDLLAESLVVAGRCANQADVGPQLTEELKVMLRHGLAQAAEDPAADLRERIRCASELGHLGDPRLARHRGPEGDFLLAPFVAIPAGSYPIGLSTPLDVFGQLNDAHLPAHRVPLAAFRMAKYLVTNAEWACFVAAGGYDDMRWWSTPAAQDWRRGQGTSDGMRANVRWWQRHYRDHPEVLAESFASGAWDAELHELWRDRVAMDDEALDRHLASLYPSERKTVPRFWHDARYNNPSQPVIGISWYEARAYAEWLSHQAGRRFRLPSEVEWEAAARGPEGRRFAYGDRFDPLGGNTVASHLKRPSPVGVFREGHTPEGLADMSGNVYQWTLSLWGGDPLRPDYRYPYDPHDGREDVHQGTKLLRVVRGGTWNLPEGASAAPARDNGPPDARYDVGLRLLEEGKG